jgi:hypothetical protein
MRFRFILVLLAAILLVTSVSATMTTTFNSSTDVIVNSTSIISDAKGVPYDMWICSILITLLFSVLSFIQFKHGEEGLISLITWFTSGFALFSAFNIDKITGSGLVVTSTGAVIFMEKHTLYHFDLIALSCLLPMFVCCLLNTGRIYLNMKAMKQIATVDDDET